MGGPRIKIKSFLSSPPTSFAGIIAIIIIIVITPNACFL